MGQKVKDCMALHITLTHSPSPWCCKKLTYSTGSSCTATSMAMMSTIIEKSCGCYMQNSRSILYIFFYLNLFATLIFTCRICGFCIFFHFWSHISMKYDIFLTLTWIHGMIINRILSLKYCIVLMLYISNTLHSYSILFYFNACNLLIHTASYKLFMLFLWCILIFFLAYFSFPICLLHWCGVLDANPVSDIFTAKNLTVSGVWTTHR